MIWPHRHRLRDSGSVGKGDLNGKRCLVGQVEREGEVRVPGGESDRDEASVRVQERHRRSGDRGSELVGENARSSRVMLESILTRHNPAVRQRTSPDRESVRSQVGDRHLASGRIGRVTVALNKYRNLEAVLYI